MATKYLKKTAMYNIFKEYFNDAVSGSRTKLGFIDHVDVPKMNHVNYYFYRGAEWIRYYVSLGGHDLCFIVYRYGGFSRFHVDVYNSDKSFWHCVYDNKYL